MIDKRVEKIKRKIRKFRFWQKIELMDWLNTWYAYYSEEEE